jgi:phosphoribosyl-AMP cyclohydrolase
MNPNADIKNPDGNTPDWLSQVRFDAHGLLPAIAQDRQTGRVLMVAWMNAESLSQTVASGQAVYWSRSRQALWRKGESSGHTQKVFDIRLDCDADVILLSVEQAGHIACHTGRESCFYRQLVDKDGKMQWTVTDPVLKDPAQIYKS